MITIKDIAREVGVSHPTVSLVLNNKAKQNRISDKLCQKVLVTAERLGYVRNEIARSMVTGKNEVIAFVSANMGIIEYTGKILEGILHETSLHNYSLKLFKLDRDKQQDIAKKLVTQKVAGVIFHAADLNDFAIIRQKITHNKIPFAMVNLSNNTNSGFGITTNDYNGGINAVKYLVRLGHQRVAYIGFENRQEYIKNRCEGYIDGMKLYSGREPIILNVPKCDKDLKLSSWYKTSVKKMMLQGTTAVFCLDDIIAMKICRAAYDLDIKIPEKLSIIGFGDLEVGKFAPVPLTTIAQPFEKMGKQASAKLIDVIEHPGNYKKNNVELEAELIIRESTAKLK